MVMPVAAVPPEGPTVMASCNGPPWHIDSGPPSECREPVTAVCRLVQLALVVEPLDHCRRIGHAPIRCRRHYIMEAGAGLSLQPLDDLQHLPGRVVLA